MLIKKFEIIDKIIINELLKIAFIKERSWFLTY